MIHNDRPVDLSYMTISPPSPASHVKIWNVFSKVVLALATAACTALFIATEGHPLALLGMLLFGTLTVISLSGVSFSSTTYRTYNSSRPLYSPEPAPVFVVHQPAAPIYMAPQQPVMMRPFPNPPVSGRAPAFPPIIPQTPPRPASPPPPPMRPFPNPPVHGAPVSPPVPFVDTQTVPDGGGVLRGNVGRMPRSTPVVEELDGREDGQTTSDGALRGGVGRPKS